MMVGYKNQLFLIFKKNSIYFWFQKYILLYTQSIYFRIVKVYTFLERRHKYPS